MQIKQFQAGPTGTTCTGAPQTPATALDALDRLNELCLAEPRVETSKWNTFALAHKIQHLLKKIHTTYYTRQ